MFCIPQGDISATCKPIAHVLVEFIRKFCVIRNIACLRIKPSFETEPIGGGNDYGYANGDAFVRGSR